jgi:hypothetical protein
VVGLRKALRGACSSTMKNFCGLLELKNFCGLLELWCGKDEIETGKVWDAIELAAIADRFQTAEVQATLEERIFTGLTTRTSLEIL